MEVTARYCNIVVDARNAPEVMLRLFMHTGPPGTVSSRRELVSFFSGPSPVLLPSCFYCSGPQVLLRSGGPRVLRAYSVPDVRLQPCSYCAGPSLVPASHAYVDPESYYISTTRPFRSRRTCHGVSDNFSWCWRVPVDSRGHLGDFPCYAQGFAAGGEPSRCLGRVDGLFVSVFFFSQVSRITSLEVRM
jgi:hypothetical protein